MDADESDAVGRAKTAASLRAASIAIRHYATQLAAHPGVHVPLSLLLALDKAQKAVADVDVTCPPASP